MTRVDERRVCAWCGGKVPAAKRSDALTCSKRCRQSKARFRVGPAGDTAGRPMRFGYADPPYPGLARRYYGTAEVNHRILIGTLEREHPDGWALSTSAKALPSVIAMCPPDARVAAWIFGARQGKSYRPRSAWEPLIVVRGRPRLLSVSEYSCDALIWGGRQSSHPGALVGMKSAAFADWMFQQLGAAVGDDLVDWFPGSGAIGRAWGLAIAAPRGERDTSCLAGAERRLEALTRAGRDESEASGDTSHGAAKLLNATDRRRVGTATD